MLKDLFNTAKHTIIYSFGNLSIKLVGFILLPLYTTYLTTSDYGLLAIIEAVAQFSIAILGFRLSTAMLRWATAEKNDDKQKSIIFTALFSSMIILTPFIISFIVFANYLSEVIFSTSQFVTYIYLIAVFIAFEIYNLFLLDLLRLRDKSIFYVVIVLLKLTINLGLNIYFVAYMQIGVEGIMYSMVISSIVFSIMTLPFLLSQIIFKYDNKTAKEMFNYGFPLIFATISSMILTLADRFVIKHFYSLSEVGIYNLGYKLSSVINVVIIQSFQMGFLPIAFKKFDQPNAKEFFSKVLTYFTFILILAIISISFYSKEIIILLAKDTTYYEAYKIVPFISYTFLIKGVYYIFSLGLHFVKKTKYNSFIVLIGAIVNLILNFTIIPYYGIYGAAVASIISSIIIMLLYYYYSQREYRIEYELKRLFILTFSSLILISSLYFINEESFIISLIVKTIILISYPFLLFFMKFFTESEMVKIRTIIKYFPNISKIKSNITFD
ncbi:MAG: hypothetical protein DRI86_15110 [Bacteroidetes bacterium]|nr:MAG: hypothetical protein DRI86_15110 [Bacteroidota bacterium]